MDDGTDDRTDDELLHAWGCGDKAAGEVLIDSHYHSVDRFFRNKVNENDLGDLTHRTFLVCLQHPDRYEGRHGASFKTYLLGVAWRVLLKHYRDDAQLRKHEALEDLSVVEMGQTPSQILATEDERRRLLEAMQHLPLQLQVVLELRFWEGMKQREIAEALELPMGTVAFRIRRGLQLLREIMGRS